MNETKFTPGPWTAEHDPAWGQWVVFSKTMPKHSPITRFASFDDACQHDAALIAAAPDLYMALRDLLIAFDLGSSARATRVTTAAANALRKARGET